MNKLMKTTTCLILFAMLFITACNNAAPALPSPGVTPPALEPTTPPKTEPHTFQPLSSGRVDVVYFHTPSRCAKCLCFEERVEYVIYTYFQEELANSRLTLTICDISDREKASLIHKYDAFASQLFINTIVNNTENIRNIKEIWDWNCLKDPQGFDAKVKDLIDQELLKIN